MDLSNNKTDFSNLLSSIDVNILVERMTQRNSGIEMKLTGSMHSKNDKYLKEWKHQWKKLSSTNLEDSCQTVGTTDSEQAATDWLINLFNTLFSDQQVMLVRSDGEPEYFPIQDDQPARIEFAHGFFASALHEISHWCVAGKDRRRLSDFGYWYAPDGRTATQQQAFERVEIKPQALECLFTLACGRHFQVSQDNLFADFDTSESTFANDVYQQVETYLANPHTLPRDAKTLLSTLLNTCQDK